MLSVALPRRNADNCFIPLPLLHQRPSLPMVMHHHSAHPARVAPASYVDQLARSLFGAKAAQPGVWTLPPDDGGFVWYCVVNEDGKVVAVSSIQRELADLETTQVIATWHEKKCATVALPAAPVVRILR